MTESKHEHLRRLFDQALELPPTARPAFLDSKCRHDADLKQRLRMMLAAADDEDFLAAPTGQDAAASAAIAAEAIARLREGPGTSIGPYKLLQQIGEGGFGVVFMAQQEQPVTRKVALKIIKLGMDTRQVVARFEQERQALALMDHAHIAKVLDAGATETGRPYFVMDLVKGDPIVEYCDKNNLTIDERLELFAQVCGAVQHAHGKGIIHRDLKPSNVLVGTQDGKPHAKVIDFGIAKATSQKLTDKTLFTEHQQVIGTLQYMSPEQAAGSLDIDTRTDVYSLGVLLYELLTGSTPFDRKTLGDAMFAEIRRMISEVEPPRPSTRLSASHDLLASIAAHRRVEPKRLGLLLRGELDWIVMKALEKDRVRRYETASALAMDIERYLRGDAVVAAPPSRSYRVKKFVSRHRGMVAAIAAVAMALLIGAIGFAWQASVASNQRDVAVTSQRAEAEQHRVADEQRVVAETQRAEAQKQQALAEEHAKAEAKERKRAEAISHFVTEALQSADPNTGGSQAMLVTDAMQQANKLLDDGRFKDDPDIEASLRSVIARILYRNGKVAEAQPLAQRAMALFEQVRPADHQDIALTLDLTATIEQELGHLDAAEPGFERSLAMLRRLHPGDDDDVSRALNNLALLKCSQGRLAEGKPLFAESLAMKQRLHPGDNEDVAMGLNNLANVLDDLGQQQESVSMFEQSLAMYERLFQSHPQLSMALMNMGNVRIGQGRLEEAEQLFTRALAMYQSLFHGDHEYVVRALSALGNIKKIRGHGDEGAPLFEQALAMIRRLFPGDHPMVASMLSQLALLRQDTGRAAEAEPLYEQALAMCRRLHEGDDPVVAAALTSLASVRRDLDRAVEAEPLLVEALLMLQRFYGGDHASIAKAMNKLASVRQALHRFAEAEVLCRDALAMTRRLQPGDHPQVAVSMAYLAFALQDLDRTAEAEPLFQQVVEMCQRYYRGDHYDTAQAWLNLARCRDKLGMADGARAAFDAGISMHRRRTPDGSVPLAKALWSSGKSRLEHGETAAALPELEAAEAMQAKLVPAENKQLAEYRETLAKCRAALGK